MRNAVRRVYNRLKRVCCLVELLPSRVELDIVRVIGTPEATHIRYRVSRRARARRVAQLPS